MTFEQWLAWISQYGFAIVIGGYLVYWLTRKLSRNLEWIMNELGSIKTVLEDILEELKRRSS